MKAILLFLAVLMGGCYHSFSASQPTLTGSITSTSKGLYPVYSKTEYTVSADGREDCREKLLAAAQADRIEHLPAPTRFQIEMICGDASGLGFYGMYSSTLAYPIF